MGEPRDSCADRRGRASQNHSTSVERRPRRLSSLISQALSFDDAYAAGEVGSLARALVQATMPHSDPKTNEFVRYNGHYTLSILAPKGSACPTAASRDSSSPTSTPRRSRGRRGTSSSTTTSRTSAPPSGFRRRLGLEDRCRSCASRCSGSSPRRSNVSSTMRKRAGTPAMGF